MNSRRALALHDRKHRFIGGFNKTVHLEQVTYPASTSSYRPGSATTVFSILIDPPPIARVTSDEDIAELGENVSLQDMVFEVSGNAASELNMRNATQLVLNKGLPDQQVMSIQQVRPSSWLGDSNRMELAIIDGVVMRWHIFARSTT